MISWIWLVAALGLGLKLGLTFGWIHGSRATLRWLNNYYKIIENHLKEEE